MAAACAWVLTITLMVVATADRDGRLAQWALLVGLGACCMTGYLIVDHVVSTSRQRTEFVVRQIMEQLQEREITRLH